jgi:hypothetical protein
MPKEPRSPREETPREHEEAPRADQPPRREPDEAPERSTRHEEEAAGGDREI